MSNENMSCLLQDKFLRIQYGLLKIKDKSYPVYKGINTIGRNVNAVINIEDVNVSSNHGIIVIVDDNQHFISDLQSTNGTYIGTRLAPFKLYELATETKVKLGNTECSYVKVIRNNTVNLEMEASFMSQNENECFYNGQTQVMEHARSLDGPEDKHKYCVTKGMEFFEEPTQIVHTSGQDVGSGLDQNFHEAETQMVQDEPTQVHFNCPEQNVFRLSSSSCNGINESNLKNNPCVEIEETVYENTLLEKENNLSQNSNNSIDFLAMNNSCCDGNTIPSANSTKKSENDIISGDTHSVKVIASSIARRVFKKIESDDSSDDIEQRTRKKTKSSLESSHHTEDIVSHSGSDTDIDEDMLREAVFTERALNDTDVIPATQDCASEQTSEHLNINNQKNEFSEDSFRLGLTELMNPSQNSNNKVNPCSSLENTNKQSIIDVQLSTHFNENCVYKLKSRNNFEKIDNSNKLDNSNMINQMEDSKECDIQRISENDKDASLKNKNNNESRYKLHNKSVEDNSAISNGTEGNTNTSQKLSTSLSKGSQDLVTVISNNSISTNQHSQKNCIQNECIEDDVYFLPTQRLDITINDVNSRAGLDVPDKINIAEQVYFQATQISDHTSTQMIDSKTECKHDRESNLDSAKDVEEIYIQATQKVSDIQSIGFPSEKHKNSPICTSRIYYEPTQKVDDELNSSKLKQSLTAAKENINTNQCSVANLKNLDKIHLENTLQLPSDDDFYFQATQKLVGKTETQLKLNEDDSLRKSIEEDIFLQSTQKIVGGIEIDDVHLSNTSILSNKKSTKSKEDINVVQKKLQLTESQQELACNSERLKIFTPEINRPLNPICSILDENVEDKDSSQENIDKTDIKVKKSPNRNYRHQTKMPKSLMPPQSCEPKLELSEDTEDTESNNFNIDSLEHVNICKFQQNMVDVTPNINIKDITRDENSSSLEEKITRNRKITIEHKSLDNSTEYEMENLEPSTSRQKNDEQINELSAVKCELKQSSRNTHHSEDLEQDAEVRSEVDQSFAILGENVLRTKKNISKENVDVKVTLPKNRRSMTIAPTVSLSVSEKRTTRLTRAKSNGEEAIILAPKCRKSKNPKIHMGEKQIEIPQSAKVSRKRYVATSKIKLITDSPEKKVIEDGEKHPSPIEKLCIDNSLNQENNVKNHKNSSPKQFNEGNISESKRKTRKRCHTERVNCNESSSKTTDESSLLNTSERKKRKLKPKVVFTMMNNPQMESYIRQLGGSVVDSVEASTVLITESLKRSQKLLSAVGKGIPICSPDWITDSKKQQIFLDPWDYILVDREAEKKWSFSLKQSLSRSLNKKLLQNYTFQVCVSTAADVLKGAIESCGGKCVNRAPGKGTSNFVIIASRENKNKYQHILKQNRTAKIVEAEAIFDGVLRQEIRFSNHLLL